MTELLDALKVISTDPKISTWLTENDPKALEQVRNAIATAADMFPEKRTMTSEEFAALPAGYRMGGFVKIDDPRGYCEGTSDLVVNLVTGELLHWSFVWYQGRSEAPIST